MSKATKTLDKIRQRPTVADIRWDDLRGALSWCGYEELQGNGSRVRFIHRAKDSLILLHKPHPSPEVGKKAIDYVREILADCGFLNLEE